MSKKNNETTYYPYRMLVTLKSQISFNDLQLIHLNSSEVKHKKLINLFQNIVTYKKIIYERGTERTYFLFFIRAIREDVLLFKLAKFKEVDIYEINDTDINEKTISNYPYIYVIVHIGNQAVLFQRNTSIFVNNETAKNILEDLFNNELRKENATLSILPITDNNDFWEYANRLEQLTEISLYMISPNMFLGEKAADEMLKEANEEYNNDSLEIGLKNSEGKLKLNSDSGISKFINYIINGGGKWKISGKEKGKEKKYTSEENKQKIYISDTKIDEQNIETDNEIISCINKVVSIDEKGVN